MITVFFWDEEAASAIGGCLATAWFRGGRLSDLDIAGGVVGLVSLGKISSASTSRVSIKTAELAPRLVVDSASAPAMARFSGVSQGSGSLSGERVF